MPAWVLTHCFTHTEISIAHTLIHFAAFVPLFYRPNQVAEKVAARISENFSEAAIVMVKPVYRNYVL